MSAFVINPYSFASAGGFACEYVATYTDAANLTTYAFTGCDFGAADANRHIVVAVMTRAVPIQISSASIGGISATIDAAYPTVVNNYSAILRANVTSGTSGTVSVTFSTTASRAAISIYRIVASTISVVDADAAAGNSAASVTIDTGSGCVIAACAANSSLGSGMSWTNVTEDADGVVEFLNYSTASDSTTAGTLTVDVNTSSSEPVLSVASYE